MVPLMKSDVDSPRYVEVLYALFGILLLGVVCFAGLGLRLANPMFLAAASLLSIAAGLVLQVLRSRASLETRTDHSSQEPQEPKTPQEPLVGADAPAVAEAGPAGMQGMRGSRTFGLLRTHTFRQVPAFVVRGAILLGGVLAVFALLQIHRSRPAPLFLQWTAAGAALLGAAVSLMIVRYLERADREHLPESTGLASVARWSVWVQLASAASVPLAYDHWQTPVSLLCALVLCANALLVYDLLRASPLTSTRLERSLALQALGGRQNIFAAFFRIAERQFGIDLRSTWALTIVRRLAEPLLLCLCLAGWLSTSFSVIPLGEQGLVERLGIVRRDHPLLPGLHAHLPWPVDRVARVAVQRVNAIEVGHEGTEAAGPENVLWTVEHAPNEYTLLLGNGRDLITVDASVQYRINDAQAWMYHCANPETALRAIAYRAVMRSTVNLTLSEALSQNIAILAEKMRGMVQKDADDLGLGVEVLAFTVGGMHPPVPVAGAYEAVVSAELGKYTAVVDAQAFRNGSLPGAQADVLAHVNTARAESAQALATAAGQAWSFRTLNAQYRAAPGEYYFRRRLETLESTLPERPYTVIDSRFLRDGGELWTRH